MSVHEILSMMAPLIDQDFDGDDIEPRCYTPSCGETEGLELFDTPYGSAYVCQTCKVSYQHQQRVREAFEGEDY